MPIVKCSYCEKEIYRAPYQIKASNNYFCNRHCCDMFRRKENNIIIKDDHAEMIIEKDNKNFICLFDIEDIDKINYIKWNIHRSSENKEYYVIGRERALKNKGKYFKFHRLIMNCPNDMVIDHINHNTLDNRKCNLRICTIQQNNENRNGCYITNISSGYRNVYWCKDRNKWRVMLKQKGKYYLGGFFTNIEDAIKVAEEMRKKYFIIKATTND